MAEHIVKIESVKDNIELQVKHHRTMLNSFSSGVLFGFGSAIGATVVFGLILFVLGKFDTVPYVGEYIENIINYLEPTTQ